MSGSDQIGERLGVVGHDRSKACALERRDTGDHAVDSAGQSPPGVLRDQLGQQAHAGRSEPLGVEGGHLIEIGDGRRSAHLVARPAGTFPSRPITVVEPVVDEAHPFVDGPPAAEASSTDAQP